MLLPNFTYFCKQSEEKPLSLSELAKYLFSGNYVHARDENGKWYRLTFEAMAEYEAAYKHLEEKTQKYREPLLQ